MSDERHGLRIERVFDAPKERVYRAFTESPLRSRWVRPADDWQVPLTELEARVGGRYRDVFVAPDGTRFEESGVFHELRAGERLVYSCRFEGGGALEPEMRVTIDLHDLGDGKTRLTLEQTGSRERKNRDEQEQGWPAFLDQLAKAVRG